MKVLVTGSRDWPDPQVVHNALTDLAPDLVIHGGCPTGADAHAEAYCMTTDTEQDVHPADWGRHGRRAGYLRNQDMVDERPDIVYAFIKDDSKGASMTVDLARKAGLPVQIWRIG